MILYEIKIFMLRLWLSIEICVFFYFLALKKSIPHFHCFGQIFDLCKIHFQSNQYLSFTFNHSIIKLFSVATALGLSVFKINTFRFQHRNQLVLFELCFNNPFESQYRYDYRLYFICYHCILIVTFFVPYKIMFFTLKKG